MPLIMSHAYPDILYTGTYRVYRNACGDDPCWEPISADLTDGIVYESRYHTISTLAEAPSDPRYLYAGTSDGNVWYSPDAGDTWLDVTAGLPNRYVTSVHASYQHPGTVWVTHSGYRANDHFPHIHMSQDHGLHWIPVSGDLPPLAINKILPYPDNDDVLFVATDGGVYVTLNGGSNWERLGDNMPYVPVFDLAWDPVARRVVAGTFARSMLSFPVDSLPLDPTRVRPGPETENPLALMITPNPSVDLVHVRVSHPSTTSGSLTLWDATGTRIRQLNLHGQEILLTLDDLLPGLYILVWNKDGVKVSGKLLKSI